MTPDDLVQKYLDGTLEPGEEDLLRRWLEEDEAHLEEFRIQIDVHATFQEEAAAEAKADPGVRGAARPARRRLRLFARRRESPSWIPFAAAALVVALGLAAAVAAFRHRPPARPVARAEAPPPRPPDPDPPPLPEPRPVPEPRPDVPPSPPTKEPGSFVKPPEPVPPPLPPPPRPPRVDPLPPLPVPPADPPKTLVAVATLAELRGDVRVQTPDGPRPAAERPVLRPGEGLVVGEGDAHAAVVFPDRSRLDLAPGTRILEVFDHGAEGGRRLRLEAGRVTAVVAPQPAGRPMVIGTLHGRATVLGTTLRVSVVAGATAVEVRDGRVGVRRTTDADDVTVVAGHFAILAAQAPPRARALRESAGLLALYAFDEGRGARIRDVSGAAPPLNLVVESSAAVRWTPGGLRVAGPTRLASVEPASKITAACRASGEITIEAWITPAPDEIPPSTEPARIVTISSDEVRRAFTLEQAYPEAEVGSPMVSGWRCRFLGRGVVQSPAGSVRPSLQHVVVTRGADGTARLFVDGAEAGRGAGTADFGRWPDSHRLALAGEFEDAGPRSWRGTFHRVAIYGRALPEEEVRRHHFAGP